MKYEKCFETNEMPDHPPTTNKIWLGLFSGCLISIILVPLLIILVMNIADSIDSVGQFWIGFSVLLICGGLFAWNRFKKMVKP